MHVFATDQERLAFLLEADAALHLDRLWSEAEAEDITLPAEELPADERPKYVTNYIGSKQKLVDWIWKHTPEGIASVLDAFSGSAVVAYMYKSKGLRVVANDRLRYAYHAARAIIENKATRITNEELQALLAENPKAGTIVRDTFKGIYFADGVHALIDQYRANIDALSGYKKDIALFALGKACLSGKGGFGHFSSSVAFGRHQDSPEEFRQRYAQNIARINALVFDNGADCQASRKEINDLLPDAKVELAYFDPPYATEFSTTNYEKSYHFLEGLMCYWDGLEIKEDTKTKFFATDHQTVTKANAGAFFTTFLGNASHIDHWLISYRDHAYPNESEMRTIIADAGKSASLRTHDHHYTISSRNSEASDAKEYLFICGKGPASTQADEHTDRITDNLQALADAPLGEAIDLLTCMAGTDDPVRVTGYMGSKTVLLGWIERQMPKEAHTLLDAFSGGANVAYHFKRKGLQVFANDLLRYPYHLARAVVENSQETLSEADVEHILAPNTDAGDFIVRTFHGYYYTKPVLQWLDQVWANIQGLPGYKKDLALAALGTVVKAKSAFGMFSRSKMQRRGSLETGSSLEQSQLSNPPLSKFIEAYRKTVQQLNSLVFDNGQACQAFNLDVVEAVRKIGADCLYLDPPYVTEFGSNDYEDSLHFIEGLMTRWADKAIQDNPRRSYPSRTKYSKDTMQALMETLASEARGTYATVLLSYRDRAYPTEDGIRAILSQHYGLVRVKGTEVEYNIAKDTSEDGKHARELLFIASRSRAQSRTAATIAEKPANCHTSLPIEVTLSAEAQVLPPSDDDPRFTCILCRAGTNKNGDHFTPDELSARYITAVNKKVDLKHSQEVTDIVGGIVGANYIEDDTGGRVECVGALYVHDTPNAQLAYKLMKTGIIAQVSMECDYEEGECSVCGKRAQSKNDYCVHLRKYKGGDFQGQPVSEILHGVTFTGLGLLDRKGADENARITQVASDAAASHSEGASMDQPNPEAVEAAKKTPKGVTPPGGGDVSAPVDDATRAKELDQENKSLKQQLLALQKQVDELLAEKKAAANRSRAQQLLRKLERQGLKFGSDEDKDTEVNRLADLSDDAFSATEAAFEKAAQTVAGRKAVDPVPEKSCEKCTEKTPDPAPAVEKPVTPPTQAETTTPPLRTDAGVRPLVVDDKKNDLEAQLKKGFQRAYQDRMARMTGDPVGEE